MITRMFEYVGGGSDKFWEVTYPATFARTVNWWECRWGRRGTAGQTKRFIEHSTMLPRIKAEAKVAEKLAKGYHEVPGSRVMRVESAVGTTSSYRPASTAVTSTRPAAKKRATRTAASSPPPASFQRPKRRITLA